MAFMMDETRTGHILVVDDDDGTRNLLVTILTSEGYEVSEGRDGLEALEAVEAIQPDVVLMDLMMPNLSGLDALEELRKSYKASALPIIMLTANRDDDNLVRGLTMGANDYLTKPFAAQVLVARVETQLKLKQLEDIHQMDLAQLRELGALKDRFILIASHDLRGPLAVITTGLQLLREAVELVQPIFPSMGTIINSMATAAASMESIISDFLDVHLVRTGQLRLDRVPLSLNALVEGVVEQFRATADKKDITITVNRDDSLPPCMADADRLIQVLNNLVDNAIKYTVLGGNIMVCTLLNGDWVRVEVYDSGQGIRKDEMNLLFEDFVRPQNRPTGGEASTGLGLSITRQLVELHGGRVGAESQRGKGSMFFFELPAEV